MWGRVLVSLTVSLSAGMHVGKSADRQPALDDLIDRISQRTASTGGGINAGESDIAKRIQAFGAQAAPRLIALLDSDNASVRELAGYVLRDLPGLSESHLDALIAACERGDGWIPPAIARIGTPRAIAFLVGELKRTPRTHNQLTWALKLAGEKAARPLAAIFDAPELVTDDLLTAVRYVFYDMGSAAAVSVPHLVESAMNPSLPMGNRKAAVRALGALGLAAASEVPRLQALAHREPDHFAEPVDQAIVEIGSPEAAAILAAQLRRAPSDLLLLRVARLRENGRAATSVVAQLLNHENWDVRVAAARTLGYIGATDAVDVLREALSDASDWRIVYSAAESLGRLKATNAVADLEAIAQRHWFDVVRSAASKAVRVIQGAETYQSRWPAANFGIEFFDYTHVRSGVPVLDPATLRFRAELEPLTESERRGLAVSGIAGSNVAPSSWLRLGPHGHLLGTDGGEWGGELVFRDAAGATHTLLHANTQGIVRMPFGIVAVTGVAHLMINHGFLYAVDFEPGRTPTARRWKSLPGAPRRVGVLENGNLFVACVGGDIVVTPSGEMLAADAKHTAPPAQSDGR
ncbi:MAG: HEAT repeat domain-containing protein [Opitutaceae bacterium]|nr:HEAT repeat domain-containing protein [Opitutaceae bacterium]